MFGSAAEPARGSAAAFLGAVSAPAVAFCLVPGIQGEYRLSKWGVAGLCVALVATAALFSRHERAALAAIGHSTLFRAAALFVGCLVLAPLAGAISLPAHLAGSLRWVLGLGFAAVVAAAHRGRDDRVVRRGLVVVMALGAASAAVVLLQALGVPPFRGPYAALPEFRAPGTFGNPNWAAAYLAPLAPLALGLAAAAPRGGRRATAWLCAGLIGLATIATLSKAGILALAAGVAVFFLAAPPSRASRLAALSAVLLGAAALAVWTAGGAGTPPWIRGRLFLWKAAGLLISRAPWSGLGIGGFLPGYREAAQTLVGGRSDAFMPLGSVQFVHQDLLQTAVEGGIVTAVAFVAFVALAAWRALRSGDGMTRGIGAGFLVVLAHGFADSPLQLPASFLVWWFLAGLLMAAPGGRQASPAPGSAKTTVAVLGLLGLLGLVQAGRLFGGVALWTTGHRALLHQESRVAVERLGQAARLLPEIGEVRYEHAKALVSLGLHDEALAEADVALSVYSDLDATYLRLRALEQLRGTAAVAPEWLALGRAFPVLVRPHYELGRIHLLEGGREQALAELGRVVASSQDTPGARVCRQQALVLMRAYGLDPGETAGAQHARTAASDPR